MLLFAAAMLFSAEIGQKKWKSGLTFSSYLEKNGIGSSLLKRITAADQEFLSEIQAGERFYELRESGKLLQALIPVGEEMQIHLYRDIIGETFHFYMIPIDCRRLTDHVAFTIEKGLYEDLDRWTKNPRLGYLLKKYYGKSVNFKSLHRGDKVSFIYKQKSRLGKPFGAPKIVASLIRNGGRNRFIFADKEGTYYDDIYKDVAYTVKQRVNTIRGSSFVRPIGKMRITSKFTYKRWHPILKRYRPHLGVDIGARRGTPIHATQAGKVIYADWMGGYGKVVKIKHDGGFVSLYAHQSRLAVKKGAYVKRNETIGYVGSTGRSTAPHLHFGLYKNAKAVNPMLYVDRKALKQNRAEVRRITKHRLVELPRANKHKREIISLANGNPRGFRWQAYVKPYNRIGDRKRFEFKAY